MFLESSIMLLENIYSKGITHDDHHIFIIKATGLTARDWPSGASKGP